MKRSGTKRTKRGGRMKAPDVSNPSAAATAHATAKIEQTIHAPTRHQVNKLVERVKAGGELTRADLGLLKQLREKFASNKAPKTEEIQILELESIQERQQRGEKLTGEEHAFLAKVQQCTLLQLSVAASTQAAEAGLTKRIFEFKKEILKSLCKEVQYSKSLRARVSALHTIRAWAYDEDCSPISSWFEVVHPELEVPTPANAGVVPAEATIK